MAERDRARMEGKNTPGEKWIALKKYKTLRNRATNHNPCYKLTGSHLYFLIQFRELVLSSTDFREALLVFTLGTTLNKREINFQYFALST